jgi:hypothetical protein
MPSRKPHIFLDCDGVLANFDTYTIPLFAMDLPPREVEAQIGSEEFWQVLREHPDFYFRLPLMPDAPELFAALAHLKPTILTGCPPGGWAEPQKLAWAAHHFPGTPMITCVARDKRLHMQPGDVLIDDTAKYRHLWEESGGIFIHHSSAAATLDALRALGVLE